MIEVNASLHQRAKNVFHRACDLSYDERDDFVANECDGDEELLREVHSLLKYDSPTEVDAEDSLDVFLPSRDKASHSLALVFRDILRRRVLMTAWVCGLILSILAAVIAKEQCNKRIEHALSVVRDAYVSAFDVWAQARIRETQQLANDVRISKLTEEFLEIAQNSSHLKHDLFQCDTRKRFYETIAPYENSHEGASVHLVSLKGVILTDRGEDFLGESVNARAFEFLVPVFSGGTILTPPIATASLVVDSTLAMPGDANRKHSFVIAPVLNTDGKIIAALAAMEFARFGYGEIFDVRRTTAKSEVYTFNNLGQMTMGTYYKDGIKVNGLVVTQSGGILVPDGSGFIFPNTLSTDVSTTGYFLFNGTDDPNPGAGSNKVWGINSLSVTPNTNHTFSFYLANVLEPSVASIEATVNGVSLGAAATIPSGAGTWQQFSYNWNSGAATSASIALNNLQFADTGNDFGLDQMRFEASAVPEPSAFLFLGIVFGGGVCWKRCKKITPRS